MQCKPSVSLLIGPVEMCRVVFICRETAVPVSSHFLIMVVCLFVRGKLGQEWVSPKATNGQHRGCKLITAWQVSEATLIAKTTQRHKANLAFSVSESEVLAVNLISLLKCQHFNFCTCLPIPFLCICSIGTTDLSWLDLFFVPIEMWLKLQYR